MMEKLLGISQFDCSFFSLGTGVSSMCIVGGWKFRWDRFCDGGVFEDHKEPLVTITVVRHLGNVVQVDLLGGNDKNPTFPKGPLTGAVVRIVDYFYKSFYLQCSSFSLHLSPLAIASSPRIYLCIDVCIPITACSSTNTLNKYHAGLMECQ